MRAKMEMEMQSRERERDENGKLACRLLLGSTVCGATLTLGSPVVAAFYKQNAVFEIV